MTELINYEGNKVKVNKFYWVLPTPDPDVQDWENELQPAFYAGDGFWFCLNEEGKSNYPMAYIGSEIKQTDDWSKK